MPTTKQCSRCNLPFECKNDEGGCWCEGYALSPDTLKDLKSAFDNCLCPTCLAEYAQRQVNQEHLD